MLVAYQFGPLVSRNSKDVNQEVPSEQEPLCHIQDKLVSVAVTVLLYLS